MFRTIVLLASFGCGPALADDSLLMPVERAVLRDGPEGLLQGHQALADDPGSVHTLQALGWVRDPSSAGPLADALAVAESGAVQNNAFFSLQAVVQAHGQPSQDSAVYAALTRALWHEIVGLAATEVTTAWDVARRAPRVTVDHRRLPSGFRVRASASLALRNSIPSGWTRPPDPVSAELVKGQSARGDDDTWMEILSVQSLDGHHRMLARLRGDVLGYSRWLVLGRDGSGGIEVLGVEQVGVRCQNEDRIRETEGTLDSPCPVSFGLAQFPETVGYSYEVDLVDPRIALAAELKGMDLPAPELLLGAEQLRYLEAERAELSPWKQMELVEVRAAVLDREVDEGEILEVLEGAWAAGYEDRHHRLPHKLLMRPELSEEAIIALLQRAPSERVMGAVYALNRRIELAYRDDRMEDQAGGPQGIVAAAWEAALGLLDHPNATKREAGQKMLNSISESTRSWWTPAEESALAGFSRDPCHRPSNLIGWGDDVLMVRWTSCKDRFAGGYELWVRHQGRWRLAWTGTWYA